MPHNALFTTRREGGDVDGHPGATMLRRLSEHWEPMWRRIEALDAEGLRETPRGSEFTVGQILAHSARWEDWAHSAITEHIKTGFVPNAIELRELSKQWAREDADTLPEEARRRLGASHARLVALLEELVPEQWDDVVVGCVESLLFPYKQHPAALHS
jgi:hypothetical protein